MAERKAKARRRPAPSLAPEVGAGEPVPLAMPGPRTRCEKALALTFAASMLATASLAGCGAPPPDSAALAPHCPPGKPASGGWGETDLDGCWEKQPDGSQRFRTSAGGRYYYHAQPPAASRYYAHGGVGG